MALFKQFHGTETELNTNMPIDEGKNYFLTDNGKMYIDAIDPQDKVAKRFCLNAAEADTAIALKNGDDELIATDLFTKEDTIGIANGGTGATDLSSAREGLQIDRAIANVIILAASDWTANGKKYQQTITLSSLKCGYAGNVPPIISPALETSMADFALLDSVEADVPNKTLTFIARQAITSDLTLIATDHQ